MKIKEVTARTILNSIGKETIEITVNGYKASAPSGTSKGKYEVRDFSKTSIKFVNTKLNKRLKDFTIESFGDLRAVEDVIKEFDTTKNLSKIGGNTLIALEFALLKALSKNNVWEFLNPRAQKFPLPLGNCIGGGKHVKNGGADIQEFLLLPKAKKFSDNSFVNSYIHRIIGEKLEIKKKDYEGAWVLNLSNIEILELLRNLLDKIIGELGIKIGLCIDVAASNLWIKNRYCYNNFSKEKKQVKLTREEQFDFICEIIKDYDLEYVEDAFEQADFNSFELLKNKFKRVLICGDDLICTNIERLKKADLNAVIVKPNQIGSLIKTKEVVDYAFKNNITTVMSHRSGETMDNTIAHLAFAWEIPIVKFGIFGKERLVKLNELIRIEEIIK